MTQPGDVSIADELRKLAELRDSGVLTEEEFQGKKQQLLAEMHSPPSSSPEPVQNVPDQSVLQAAQKTVVFALSTQDLADHSGGPEIKRAARDLVTASVKCEQVAAQFGVGMPLALALGELSAAAKTCEQACRIDGRPESVATIHTMVVTLEKAAQNILSAAQKMA